jgi:1-acyl-sn-glycerol-3-phosphate acyltransferase
LTRTIFNTPIVCTLCQSLASFVLWLAGWKTTGNPPELKKYVLICGPHTSNWDFPLLLLVMLDYQISIQVLGKKSLFPVGFGWLMKWLGLIPVDRSKSTNLAAQVIDAFNASDEMVLVIAPEGTRGKVGKFKTGFYHIASGAKVPVALGYCDYSKKRAGFGPIVEPNGDIDSQLPEIQAFFRGIPGKNPQHGM